MNSRYRAWAAGLLALLWTSSAHAAPYCAGTVTQVAINPFGTVWANVQGVGNKAYCDLSTVKNADFGPGVGVLPIPIVPCQTLYSTLMTAKVTGTPVILYFNSDVTCDANGAPSDWFDIFPYYVVMSS